MLCMVAMVGIVGIVGMVGMVGMVVKVSMAGMVGIRPHLVFVPLIIIYPNSFRHGNMPTVIYY